MTADDVRRLLALEPHPLEGGHFRETWRSSLVLDAASLPAGYDSARAAGTAIYFLITPEGFSALHRLPTDEVFHFYAGDPVEMLLLEPGGASRLVILGADLAAGARPQVVVPRDTWQGSRLAPGGAWALIGTTMAPAFDPRDYEHGIRDALLRDYPDRGERIAALTRG